jgi:CBS domain-containing protein
MTVARILKDKGRAVATVTGGVSLNDVIHQLAARNIGALVVVDHAGAVSGIISERDIVRILADNPASTLNDPVAKHMTRPVLTCSERTTSAQLMVEMTTNRFRHLPVLDDGRLVGIVSIGDVLKQRVVEADLEAHSLREYIATG